MRQNKRMLFFVNPKAGQQELKNSLMDVLQIFTAGGYDVTVHPTQGPGDLTDWMAREAGGYDLVVCAGGDGTLNEAVSGLMRLEKRPPLGYIPSGTVNDVAATLGLRRNPVEAARDIVGGKPCAIDIGSFGPDRWFTYVAGFGAFTDVAYETPQHDKRLFGRMAYLIKGVQSLGEILPVPVRFDDNGQTVEDQVLLGLVCSTTSVGGFKAKSDLGIRLDDGLSEVILVKTLSSLADLNALAGMLLKREFDPRFFYAFQTDRIHFEFPAPVRWTLDGEFGGSVEQVDVWNNHQAIEIMVP